MIWKSAEFRCVIRFGNEHIELDMILHGNEGSRDPMRISDQQWNSLEGR